MSGNGEQKWRKKRDLEAGWWGKGRNPSWAGACRGRENVSSFQKVWGFEERGRRTSEGSLGVIRPLSPEDSGRLLREGSPQGMRDGLPNPVADGSASLHGLTLTPKRLSLRDETQQGRLDQDCGWPAMPHRSDTGSGKLYQRPRSQSAKVISEMTSLSTIAFVPKATQMR